MVAIHMNFPRLLRLALAFVLLALPTASRAAEALPLSEIIHRAILRDDALRASRHGMKCDQTVKVEHLDSDGKVTGTSTDRTVHLQTAAITYNTDVAAQGSDGAGVAKQQTEHVEAVMNLGRLAGKFQMALAEDAKIRDRECYVVRYWPRNGQSSETREEKVVNNLKGRFWIAKDDFSIVQSDGTLSGPVSVALIASVNQMDFSYHSQTLANGDVAPADVSVNIAVKAPFYDYREKKKTTQENWRH